MNAAPRKNYRGETFLFLFQNLHRYALYAAILLVFILSYDAYLAWAEGEPGLVVGKIILTINPILIGAYTFGCHSFRHLIGGNLNCFFAVIVSPRHDTASGASPRAISMPITCVGPGRV